MRKFLSIAMILLAVLNLLDMGITTCLLSFSRVVAEANIIMNFLWHISPLLFIAYKVLISIGLVWVVYRIQNVKKWMYVAIVPVTALYCGIVGWSVYVLVTVI